jgi:hypothetical protein
MNVDIRITIDVTQGALTVREDRESDPDPDFIGPDLIGPVDPDPEIKCEEF